MAKFELTRKYLVSFLAAAVLLMTFAMPLAPASAADLNAVYVTTVSAPDYPSTTAPTYPLGYETTLTILLTDGGNPVDPPTTATMYVYNANLTGSAKVATHTGVGTWTATWASATATVIPFVAYLDGAGTGQPNPAYPPSDNEYAEWADPVATAIFAEPLTATNNITEGHTTHTITITVKDQFGTPISATVNVGVTGSNSASGSVVTNSPTTGTATYGYSNSATPAVSGTFGEPTVFGNDTITATIDGTDTSTQVAKVWTFTPTLGSWTLSPATATNVAGEDHTVTASFFDQYGNPLTLTGTMDWAVTGENPTTGSNTFSGTSTTFTYTGTKVGLDTITATLNYAGTSTGPKSVTKYWTVDTGYILTLAPETATNLVGTTHTVTALLTDQYGNPVTATTVAFSVEPTTQVYPTTGVPTTDSSGNAPFSFTSTKNQTTVITASALGVTATATKVWTSGTPSTGGSGWVTPGGTVATATWYNMVNDTHTATVFVGDQYGNLPDPLPAFVSYTITSSTGDTTLTGTAAVDPATGLAIISWTRAVAGIDAIAVTIDDNKLPLTIATGTKFWSNEWNVGPLEQINAIGTEHQFVIKGAPYEPVAWRLYQNDHGLIQIRHIQASTYLITSPLAETVPTGFHDSFTGIASLDATGSATFTVYSKAPFKYYFETDFYADLVNGAKIDARHDPYSAVRHVTQTHWEVAKIYAVLTRSEIGPITQDNDITGTDADHHTVTATVYGKYYWYGAWSAEVPVQNARVDWTVTYADSFDRNFVACTVDPGANPTQDTPGTLKATSFTNALGVATFTYALNIGSSTLIPSPLHDHITAYDHYTEAVLDLDYPPPPLQEADKYWYDHPFKLIKHVAGDRNQVIPNVELFLKSGTDTYYHNGWAHLALPDNFTVKTDTYGAAVWYHLPTGSYTIYENIPTGYVGGGTTQAVGTFSVPGDTGIYTGVIYTRYIPNTPTTPTGCIQLTKRANSFTGTLMSGVVFDVSTSGGTPVSSYTTDASGLVEFCPLPASWTATTWYKVHENVPSGYLPVSDFWFYLPPGGGTGTGFFNSMSPTDWASSFIEHTLINRTPTTPTGWIDLHKVSDTSSPLENVEFAVSTSGGTPAGTFYTDAAGDVTFGPLTASQTDTAWYQVHETAPSGYYPVPDFWFYLPPGGGEGTGFFATEGATVPLFVGTLTNHRIPITPTGTTNLSKLTYCFLHLAGASFRVTDTATPANTWVFGPTDAHGDLTIGPLPAPRAESWYLVHEEVTPPGYMPVADFYFYLDGTTGAWNGKYYVAASTAAAEVWPLAAHPTDPTEPPAHWVVDQQNPAVPISINDLAADPTSGVSFWRPVTISANSPAVGQWSGKIYTPDGIEIGTLPGSEGLAFSAAWAPAFPNAYPVGSYYAVVQLTDGAAITLTDTVFFDVYNYEVKILSVSFLDGGLQPIVNPIAGLPFYVKAEIQNVQTGTVTTAFIPVMIGTTYIGAGGVGGLLPGQVMQTYIYSPMGLAAGTYPGHAYVWVSTILPTPISLPFDFTVTVVSAP